MIDSPLGTGAGDDNNHSVQQSAVDSGVIDELRRHADFVYPYEKLGGVPVKVAASALAHRFAGQEHERFLSRPAFLSDEKLSAAEKGTALHAFMQFADFASARRDPAAELEHVVAEGYLTRAQADSIDRERAMSFINSPLVSRALNAEAVYKEYRFNIKIPPRLVDPSVGDRFDDEAVILQGAVDLAFVEDGALVIVDYKTDRVKQPEQLVERYAAQLMLYKDALEQCIGLPVKECLIYSIRHSSEVPVYRREKSE